jgi:hypothetical protein
LQFVYTGDILAEIAIRRIAAGRIGGIMSLRPDEHLPARPAPWARLLLLIPFVAVLWVPFYNSVEPSLYGVPFFYWYQLGWIILSAVIIGIVYRLEH